MRLNDVKPGGLTPDEEAEYNAYLSIREHLPTLLLKNLNDLKKKEWHTSNPQSRGGVMGANKPVS